MVDTNCEICAIRDVGSDTVAIDIETPVDFDAAPGQFVTVSAQVEDETVERYFTISSSNVDDTFEITVEVDSTGTFSPWLANRESGDTIGISGPYGDQYYEGESQVVVIAAGPGIGPAVGIGEATLHRNGSIAIIFPGESDIHRDRLDDIETQGGQVIRSPDDLVAALGEAIGETDPTIFVYGFNSFVERALDALRSTGYDSERAKVERFGPG